MNVLEKILEEIEEMRNIMESTVAIDCFEKDCEYNDCTVCVCERAMEIIRSHMDDVENGGWIPVEERLPENDDYIMLSFENFTVPEIGRYEEDEDGGGSFYLGDDDEGNTCASAGLFVNAWRPLPEPYKGE